MTTINSILKIIYFASLATICFCILTTILLKFIPLEFTNSTFDQYRFYSFLIALPLTLCGTIKQSDRWHIILSKVAGTILITFVAFFIIALALFADMCSWTTAKVLFQKINDPSTKIVLRSFGCGATDSSKPVIKVFKIKEITKNVIWVTNIDTTTINRKDWVSYQLVE